MELSLQGLARNVRSLPLRSLPGRFSSRTVCRPHSHVNVTRVLISLGHGQHAHRVHTLRTMASDYQPIPGEPAEPWVPVGTDEIAERLGVTRTTVTTWRQRSRTWVTVPPFPEPRGKISGRDWWWWITVEEWAERAGRLPPEEEPPRGPVYRPRRGG